MNNATSIAHRLSAAVEKVTGSGCWIWMGREWRGYGLLSVKYKNTRAVTNGGVSKHYRRPVAAAGAQRTMERGHEVIWQTERA